MAVSDQMEMAFNEASIGQDSVSGNDIPIGSLPEEVRDDVPAMLSEGEYVVPADVLRFYGLKFFEDLRSEAKVSLSQMEQNGRMGGEPMSPEEAGPGMEAPAFRDGGVQRAVDAGYPKSPVENANTGLDKYMDAVTTPPEPKPMYRGGMAGYSAGGSVEDLLSDMKHYSDGGPVVNSYAAGGAIPYLDLQENYPRQSTFDPMNYGLGFSGNLISPAPAYKTAEAIKEDSGVTPPDEVIKPQEPGGPDNNPHDDPANMGLSGMTIGQIEQNLSDLQPNEDDNFIIAKLKAWQLSNTEKYKTTETYRDKLAKEVISGNQAAKDTMTSDNYSAPDTTGGGYDSQQSAENAAAAGINDGNDNSGGSSSGSSSSSSGHGSGPRNKGGFISRRKKT
jgi:hypothetical protein